MPRSNYQAQLPLPVRLRAESQGEGGRQWLAALNEMVAQLATQWNLDIGAVLSGGSESLVAQVQTGNGRAAILKIGLPGSADLATEAKIFRLAAGRGYAELLAHDPAHNALLLERLGPALRDTVTAVDLQLQVLCRTLQKAWLPLTEPHALMTGAEKAIWLASFILEKWQALEHPCAKAIIDQALTFTAERAAAHTSANAVLVHGDAHANNALLVEDTQIGGELCCKFVDPDGLFAEKACDLAVPMRDWSAELLAGDTLRLAHERCASLAALTAVDERAIWQWGFMERVSTGLHMLELGMKTEALATLAVAERIC